MKPRVHQESLAQALRTEHNSKTSHKEARIRNEYEKGRKEKADRAAGRGTQSESEPQDACDVASEEKN